jgi:hypothetical protein
MHIFARLRSVRLAQTLGFCAAAILIACPASFVVGDKNAGLEAGKTKESQSTASPPAFRTEKIRGRFVWLADALKKEFGVTTVAEISENVLAIKTSAGELFPIVENVRGRAFRKDARLREMELELTVRKFEKQPFVQIVGTFEVDGDQRLEIDYWCDVCAIAMYEAGPCSCCQDDNRIRKRRVANGETLNEEVGDK